MNTSKLLALTIIFLMLCSLFVVADPLHKDNPGKSKDDNPNKGKGHKDKSTMNLIDTSAGMFFNDVDYSEHWSEWSEWWTLFNILSDPPVVG